MNKPFSSGMLRARHVAFPDGFHRMVELVNNCRRCVGACGWKFAHKPRDKHVGSVLMGFMHRWRFAPEAGWQALRWYREEVQALQRWHPR